MKKMKKSLLVALSLTTSSSLLAATYKCEPEYQSIWGERVQKSDFIKNFQPSTTIYDDKKPKIERCSFSPSQNRMSCDVYEIDKVENDSNVGIKKYYVFRSQYDVQVFRDMGYIDNNGRGGFQIGKCKLISP